MEATVGVQLVVEFGQTAVVIVLNVVATVVIRFVVVAATTVV